MNRLSNFILTKIGTDGLMHFSISASATAVLSLILPAWIAFLIVFMCGIAKEIYDKVSGKGTPEWKDILCDAAGCVIGAM